MNLSHDQKATRREPSPRRLWKRFLPVALSVSAAPLAAQTTQPVIREFDACGVLVASGSCVLFEGGGGRYRLSDYGRFRTGDMVRVVGFLDAGCTTICPEIDGCIAAAEVYDPMVLPCGQPIRSLADLPGELCTLASGALTAAAAGGLFLARRRIG